MKTAIAAQAAEAYVVKDIILSAGGGCYRMTLSQSAP
jgi:hypothetical protein